MHRATEHPEVRSAVREAAEWLDDYLMSAPDKRVSVADIKRDGEKAGHKYDPDLKRAKRQLRVGHENRGFPRRTYWLHPSQVNASQQSGQP